MEKLSLALTHSLKEPDTQNKVTHSKSEKSEQEESVSMKDEFDEISDVYNEKLKRELEIMQTDLHKLRTDYEELSQQNLKYK